jgi:radical SAM protein with 4Fe4S-binding SPASM domain
MSKETVVSISKKLKEFNYRGRLGWSGNGEPLLTKNFLELTKMVSEENPGLSVHEINTNGDLLTEKLISDIYNSGINHIIVSVYDGEEALSKFKSLFERYKCESYTLRVSFVNTNPIGFTNRGGMVKVNVDKIKEFKENKCYLPFYKLVIDWNGDILICCEDWSRRSKSRLNINTHTLSEIWSSTELNEYRNKLKDGIRSLSPCNVCNIHGEKVGENLVKIFYEK